MVRANPYFRLRMLSVLDAVKDYAAVMKGVEHLRGHRGQQRG
jgi:hypothetical protein